MTLNLTCKGLPIAPFLTTAVFRDGGLLRRNSLDEIRLKLMVDLDEAFWYNDYSKRKEQKMQIRNLHGIKPLETFFTNWLQRHDFDAVAKIGTDFEVDLSSNTIYFALAVPAQFDEEFLAECRKYAPDIVAADTFLLSFFHELGHIETEDEWTAEEWESYDKFVNTPDDHTVEEYFAHPIEATATAWGAQWIVRHPAEIEKFVKEYTPKIKKFYQLNNITD